jgi:hypothetical protein
VQPVAESGCGEITEGDVAALVGDVVTTLNTRTDDNNKAPIEELANAVFE